MKWEAYSFSKYLPSTRIWIIVPVGLSSKITPPWREQLVQHKRSSLRPPHCVSQILLIPLHTLKKIRTQMSQFNKIIFPASPRIFWGKTLCPPPHNLKGVWLWRTQWVLAVSTALTCANVYLYCFCYIHENTKTKKKVNNILVLSWNATKSTG